MTWYAGAYANSCCASVSPLAASKDGDFKGHKNQPP